MNIGRLLHAAENAAATTGKEGVTRAMSIVRILNATESTMQFGLLDGWDDDEGEEDTLATNDDAAEDTDADTAMDEDESGAPSAPANATIPLWEMWLLALLERYQNDKGKPDYDTVQERTLRSATTLRSIAYGAGHRRVMLGAPRPRRGRGVLPQHRIEELARRMQNLPCQYRFKTVEAAKWMGINPSTYSRLRWRAEIILAKLSTVVFSQATAADAVMLLSKVTGASSRVWVAMYAFTLPTFAEALVQLHKRKLQVCLVCDKVWASSSTDALRCLQQLLQAGILCYHLGSYMMHLKLIIVDALFCAFGSPNLSMKAYGAYRECLAQLNLAQALQAANIFQGLFDDSAIKTATFTDVTKQLVKLQEKKAKKTKAKTSKRRLSSE